MYWYAKLNLNQFFVYKKSSKPYWQLFPVVPAGHMHLYKSSTYSHVAPFEQGLLKHGVFSKISTLVQELDSNIHCKHFSYLFHMFFQCVFSGIHTSMNLHPHFYKFHCFGMANLHMGTFLKKTEFQLTSLHEQWVLVVTLSVILKTTLMLNLLKLRTYDFHNFYQNNQFYRDICSILVY